MKVFFKWTIKAFILLFVIGLIEILNVGLKKAHIVDGLLFICIGSFILGGVFWLIEMKFYPWRKIRLNKRISKIFDSTPVTDTVTHFKYGMIDVYTKLEFELHMSQYYNGQELISFHIPQNQTHYLQTNGGKIFQESVCNGIQTFQVHQTNSIGLKFAKKRLDKILI